MTDARANRTFRDPSLGPNGLKGYLKPTTADMDEIYAYLRQGQIDQTAKQEAAARADAYERANDPTTPQFVRAFTNGVVPGHRRADKLDAWGGGLETAVNRALTGFDDYTPEQATAAVLEANAVTADRYRKAHPAMAYGADVAANLVQDRLLRGWGAAAGPLAGAVEGADRSSPGSRLAGAVEGAAVENGTRSRGGPHYKKARHFRSDESRCRDRGQGRGQEHFCRLYRTLCRRLC